MSVLIKGMEMPTGDEMLCINIFPDGKVTSHFDLRCMPVAKAVSVPPHGRLIERKAFFKLAHETEDLSLDELAHLAVLVAATPTIIPAEEGE